MSSVSGPSEILERRMLLAGATLFDDGILEIIGTIKSDTILVNLDNRLRVTVNKESFSFDVSDVEGIVVRGGADNDRIEFGALTVNPDRFEIPVTIFGANGDDFIAGPASRTRIFAGQGNDTVLGGWRRDIIYGENGDDSIDGGNGNDFLRGGEGRDTIRGGLGLDQIYGDGGNDTLVSARDIWFRRDDRPVLTQPSFDFVDGGAGKDRADVDDLDFRISIESTFVER